MKKVKYTLVIVLVLVIALLVIASMIYITVSDTDSEQNPLEEKTLTSEGITEPGYVLPAGTQDIPNVVASSKAWSEYCNSEYYVNDLIFHYVSENYVICNYYGDDFDVLVECIDGKCNIKVTDLSYNTLWEVHE